jgi:hypothetical protein
MRRNCTPPETPHFLDMQATIKRLRHNTPLRPDMRPTALLQVLTLNSFRVTIMYSLVQSITVQDDEANRSPLSFNSCPGVGVRQTRPSLYIISLRPGIHRLFPAEEAFFEPSSSKGIELTRLYFGKIRCIFCTSPLPQPQMSF